FTPLPCVLIRLSPYFTAQMDRGVFIFIELEFGSLMFFVTDTTKLLSKYDCDGDVAIYYDNKRLKAITNLEENCIKWIKEERFKGSDFTEYANDETITMTYDSVTNFETIPECLTEFEKLIEEYGYWYELGHSWDLSLYKIEREI
ncbi:MAG: hypothetical protein ACYC0N_00515, partial [Carboxydocellales bacterium]